MLLYPLMTLTNVEALLTLLYSVLMVLLIPFKAPSGKWSLI